MKITQVYYKTIRHFLPHLSQWVKDSVTGWRAPERIKYRVTNVVLSTIGLFMLKEGSRRSFNEDRADGPFAENLAEVFDLDGVPHGDTMAYFYQGSEPEQVHQVRVACVRHLLRHKALDPYRLLGKYVLVVFGGTGAITYKEKHCERCLTRKLSNGQTLYYHPILEAKIVTWHGLSISLGTEFIENQPGETKQDCELKAFYRLAPKIKKDFPRLAICALMDGLMAGEPTFALCRQLNWRYLIVLQDDDLPSVWEEVAS